MNVQLLERATLVVAIVDGEPTTLKGPAFKSPRQLALEVYCAGGETSLSMVQFPLDEYRRLCAAAGEEPKW